MASHVVENYVKAIYRRASPQMPWVATGEIAEGLGVSPGTVTSMVKTLHAQQLVEYQAYRGVRLTEAGRALALRVLRRHRLLETFFCHVLDLRWDEVHEDAERMEHVVSDFLVERIDSFLGQPAFDPHGDPIPSADGTVAAHAARSLDRLKRGDRFRLVHVVDQSKKFLQYLEHCGLVLDACGEVIESQQEAGIVVVSTGKQQATLSLAAAAKLMVVAPPGDDRPRKQD